MFIKCTPKCYLFGTKKSLNSWSQNLIFPLKRISNITSIRWPNAPANTVCILFFTHPDNRRRPNSMKGILSCGFGMWFFFIYRHTEKSSGVHHFSLFLLKRLQAMKPFELMFLLIWVVSHITQLRKQVQHRSYVLSYRIESDSQIIYIP